MTSTPTTASGATTPVDDALVDDASEAREDLDGDEALDTTETSHAADAAGDPTSTTGGPRLRARHRRWILLTILTVLLAGAITSTVYLWQVSEAWIERDAQWRSHAVDLTSELAETDVELADTVAELEVVRGQLDQAQVRISELADEKARLGDEHAVVRQLADYQERVSEVAATVVSALDSCIATQQRLVRWYADTAAADEADEAADDDTPPVTRPNPALLASLTTSVESVCQSAQEAKDALQEELDG